MRNIASAVILSIYIFGLPVWAIDGDSSYIFAVSACPPWKTAELEEYSKYISQLCHNDVEIFTESVKKTLEIPSKNIFSLLNQQATYEGLKKGLAEFADKVPEGSRAILLFNLHGVLSDVAISNKSGSWNDFLVLWTEDKPFTLLSAIALKQWISAEELRGMIDAVVADEIVIVVDACDSGGAVPEIIRKHGRGNDWQGREAVITSSKANQLSFTTINGSYGLFTYYLSKSLGSGFPNFKSAFENAAMETNKYLAINHEDCSQMLWNVHHKRGRCVQTPLAYDPTNLLPTIKLKVYD